MLQDLLHPDFEIIPSDLGHRSDVVEMEKSMRVDSVRDESIPFRVVCYDFSEDVPESWGDRHDVWSTERARVVIQFCPTISIESVSEAVRRTMIIESGAYILASIGTTI